MAFIALDLSRNAAPPIWRSAQDHALSRLGARRRQNSRSNKFQLYAGAAQGARAWRTLGDAPIAWEHESFPFRRSGAVDDIQKANALG
jgi:hypothetical protein